MAFDHLAVPALAPERQLSPAATASRPSTWRCCNRWVAGGFRGGSMVKPR